MIGHLLSSILVLLFFYSSWTNITVRITVVLLVILFVYLNNDYYDVDNDLLTTNNPDRKTFLLDHLNESLGLQAICVGFALVIAGTYEVGLLLGSLASLSLGWIYSAYAKDIPFFDIVTFAGWGGSILLLSFPVVRLLGWILVGQLVLLTAVSQTIQVLRDQSDDRKASLQTTAVTLGSETTYWLAQLLITASALYGIGFLHQYFGALMVLPLAISFSPDTVNRYWLTVRAVLGIGWVSMLFWVLTYGETFGLLLRVGPSAELGLP
jgi:4-hydroxybenzoate polyprenyltransferase